MFIINFTHSSVDTVLFVPLCAAILILSCHHPVLAFLPFCPPALLSIFVFYTPSSLSRDPETPLLTCICNLLIPIRWGSTSGTSGNSAQIKMTTDRTLICLVSVVLEQQYSTAVKDVTVRSCNI